ncbi:hypothetical protein COP1_028184 [Malus domestica]
MLSIQAILKYKRLILCQDPSNIPTVPGITHLEYDHSISMLESVDPISFPTMVVVPVQSDLNNSASVVDVGNMTLTTEVTPVVNVSTPVLDQVVNNATLVTNVKFFTSGADNMTLVASPLADEVDVVVAHIRSNDDDGFTPVVSKRKKTQSGPIRNEPHGTRALMAKTKPYL